MAYAPFSSLCEWRMACTFLYLTTVRKQRYHHLLYPLWQRIARRTLPVSYTHLVRVSRYARVCMGQVWPLFFDARMCRGAVYDYGWAKHAGLSRTGMVYVCAVADFVCFGWFFLLSACADQMLSLIHI